MDKFRLENQGRSSRDFGLCRRVDVGWNGPLSPIESESNQPNTQECSGRVKGAVFIRMLLKQFCIRCVLTVAMLVRLPLGCLAWIDLRLARFNLWLTEKLTGQKAPFVRHKAVNAVEGQAGTDIPDLGVCPSNRLWNL